MGATKSKLVSNIPPIEYRDLASYVETKKVLLISSKSALKTVGKYLTGINIVSTILIESANKEIVDQIIMPTENVDICYAVGGGKVIDVARYLAKKWELKVVCIPTIISTDAFLVDCTGLRENNGVTYYPSKQADKVIVDMELIKMAGVRYNLAGCGDVLSIYTGLHDWKTYQDNYVPGIAVTALGILEGLILEADEIQKGTDRGLVTIITQLAMEVQLCYFYGNSRPEEGGEHFFVYCLENKFEATLHGEMVCFGILLTAFLQGQPVTHIRDFMDKVKINYRPKGLTLKIVLATLKEISSYVREHDLKESVYNHFSYQRQEAEVTDFVSTIL